MKYSEVYIMNGIQNSQQSQKLKKPERNAGKAPEKHGRVPYDLFRELRDGILLRRWSEVVSLVGGEEKTCQKGNIE